MTLKELIDMTRFYSRDANEFMFSDNDIKIYINQAIDRIKQFDKVFSNLTYLILDSDSVLLPSEWHYMLALFSSSRMYDNDERFYEGTQKRNEFEQLLNDLLDKIQSGNVILKDAEGNDIIYSDSGDACIDYVTDAYFTTTTSDEGEV